MLDALKSSHPQANSTNAMRNAIYVILNSEDDSPSNTKFLEFYFSRFNDWPKELQSLLPEAIKHSVNHPKLLDDIVDLVRKTPEKDHLRKEIDSCLKKFAPKRYPIIAKGLNAWNALAKMKLNDCYKQTDRDYVAYEKISDIAKKIEALDGFDTIRGSAITDFLDSEYNPKQLLAIYLARNELPAYVDVITYLLLKKETRDQSEYWYTLQQLKNKTAFAKHAKDLMKNGPKSFKFALQTLDSPEKHKDIIIKEMLTNSQEASKTAWEFLAKQFPKEKKHFQQLVVDAIKRLPTPLKPDDIFHLMDVLRISDYKGHDFDQWLSQRAFDSQKVLHLLSLEGLMILNPSPDILVEKILPIMPNDTRTYPCNITEMLKCPPQNRPKVLKFLLRRFASCHDRDIVLTILDAAPELAYPITRSALKAFVKEASDNGFDLSNLSSFAYAIRNRSEVIGALRGCLTDNVPEIRAMAALTLSSRYMKEQLAEEMIKNTILSHNEPSGLEIYLWRRATSAPKRYKHDEYVAILKRAFNNIPEKMKQYGEEYRIVVLDRLSRINIDAIPILEDELKKYPDMPRGIKNSIEKNLRYIKGR